MNILIKKFSFTLLSLTLVVLSVFSAFSATIYEYNGLKYTIINNYSVSVCGRSDTSNFLSVPNTINNREVAEIGNRAFLDDLNITGVNFSRAKSLSYIGMYAFKGCENLTGQLELTETIKELGTAAFENCINLEAVKFLSNCSSVSDQCFNKCTKLSSVVFNEKIKSIGKYAFADCPNLNYIILPKNVTDIAKSAFNNDENLTIGCYYNSYAFEYAIAHNINVDILDPLYGDANEDDEVNIVDVTFIQKYRAGYDVSFKTKYGEKCADVNKDGQVTVRDATLIQMKLAKMNVDF